MNDKTYDIIKFVALLVAPIATFAASIVSIWNIPYGAQIVATISAFDVLCGAIVVIAKQIWEKKGGGSNV